MNQGNFMTDDEYIQKMAAMKNKAISGDYIPFEAEIYNVEKIHIKTPANNKITVFHPDGVVTENHICYEFSEKGRKYRILKDTKNRVVEFKYKL